MSDSSGNDPIQLAKQVGTLLLKSDVRDVQRIVAGKNSRVFKLGLPDNSFRILKFYFSHASDKRDRLGVEYQALQFLKEAGVNCVPTPLAKNDEHRAALYSYLPGASKEKSSINEDDLDTALAFVGELHRLSRLPSAKSLPDASEATFSFGELFESIDERVGKLESIQDVIPSYRDAFAEYLKRLRTFFNEIRFAVETNLKEDDKGDLVTSQRTLSPSDFGFHNALFERGTWSFLDFEYFGWDDPGKLISDFILHPAMGLSEPLQKYFVRKAVAIFEGGDGLGTRLPYLHSLYGIKWCAIILNEFVPEYRARRGFAAWSPDDLERVLDTQLTKAKMLLDTLISMSGVNFHV